MKKNKKIITGEPFKGSFGEHVKNMLPMLKLDTPENWNDIFEKFNKMYPEFKFSISQEEWLKAHFNAPTKTNHGKQFLG
jgi:hypothetical protein